MGLVWKEINILEKHSPEASSELEIPVTFINDSLSSALLSHSQ